MSDILKIKSEQKNVEADFDFIKNKTNSPKISHMMHSNYVYQEGNSNLSFKNKSFVKQSKKDKWGFEDSELVNGSHVQTRFFTDTDIDAAPTLFLEELDGNILQGGKLMINASGLINGERKMNDGITFFGTTLVKV